MPGRLSIPWIDISGEMTKDPPPSRVIAAWKEAIKFGTMTEGPRLDVREMFDDVYEEVPLRLKRQRQQLVDMKGKQS